MDQKLARKILCALLALFAAFIAINAAPHHGGGYGYGYGRGYGDFGTFFSNNLAAFGLTILPNGSIYNAFTGGILSGIVASNITNANFATNPGIDVRTGVAVG